MVDENKGHRKRLRERFINANLEAFSKHEIIELLLTFTLPRRDTKPIAKDLIKQYGSVAGILDAPVEKLKKIDGIGEITPILIKFFKELLAYYLYEKDIKNRFLSSTEDVVSYFRTKMQGLPQEEFKAVYLSTKNKILDVETIAAGTVDHSVIYPREIIKKALNHNAKSIILVHNHPSGDPNPSEADKEITRKLKIICELMDINVYDHVIIGKNSYISFAQKGWM